MKFLWSAKIQLKEGYSQFDDVIKTEDKDGFFYVYRLENEKIILNKQEVMYIYIYFKDKK